MAQSTAQMAYPSAMIISDFALHGGCSRLNLPRASSVPKAAISLALALLAALVLIGINEVGHSRSSAALDTMARQVQVRASLDQLLHDVLEAEAGSRRFLLTRRPARPATLRHRGVGRRQDPRRPGPGGRHTPDDAAVLDQLREDVQRKLAEMDESVRMRGGQ